MALAGSSEVSRGTQEAATRGVAWRDRAEATPCLPREQLDILFEPLLPFALAQVPVTQQWAWLHHSFILTEPRSRSCLPFEGHILSGPRLWSARMGTSTCCL